MHDRREINSDFTNGEGSAVRRGGPAGRGTRQAGWRVRVAVLMYLMIQSEQVSGQSGQTDRQIGGQTDRQTHERTN